MAKMLVSAERMVDAPADVVYRYVADMHEHHPHFLPPAFSGFRVESGGVGAGTITRFKDNNTAERALRNSVIGRKNFYGSGARWAADLAADVWTITATAAQNGLEPLPLLEDYLTACAQAGGTAPAGAELEPFLPWTPQGRARRAVPARTRRGPGP